MKVVYVKRWDGQPHFLAAMSNEKADDLVKTFNDKCEEILSDWQAIDAVDIDTGYKPIEDIGDELTALFKDKSLITYNLIKNIVFGSDEFAAAEVNRYI